jgi:preprotein translocase subunit SecB
MSDVESSTFQFTGFQIIESHIVRKEIEKKAKDLRLSFNPRGLIDKVNKTYKIYLGIHIEDSEKILVADFEMVGNFMFSDFEGIDNAKSIFYINAPAILFPYVRAYISTITNLSGNDTITLPTLNLSSLGSILKENTKLV